MILQKEKKSSKSIFPFATKSIFGFQSVSIKVFPKASAKIKKSDKLVNPSLLKSQASFCIAECRRIGVVLVVAIP